ncbi:MAG: hypothetical protein FWF20_02810 [Betaproteobacteria bacterium]|nr:hypothetical protein [Betaproteobacteria bacterium]MCL2885713.1 hypothetical protein [Betaproteobacteria bacterium]
MTGLSVAKKLSPCKPKNKARFLTATSLLGGNVFAVLIEAVKYCSLGQISTALYEVGGQYRRSM